MAARSTAMGWLERADRQTRLCVLACRALPLLWLLLPLSSPLPAPSPLPPLPPLPLATCAFLAILTFLAGLATANVSQVDKLWSLAPALYCLLLLPSPASPRGLLMLALTLLWGGRLTYNFYRRGGYAWPPWRGEEDYRWAIVRTWPVLNTALGWGIFHAGFICSGQGLLLLGLALPALPAAASPAPLHTLDLLAAVTFLLLIAVETVADQQQWEFQAEKAMHREQSAALPPALAPGFPSHGLFALCRHPNYLAEQLLWLTFYLFSVSATGSWLNYTLAGPLALVLLFQGSTNMSEDITGGKYPQYRRYQAAVPRFLGNFWRLADSYPGLHQLE